MIIQKLKDRGVIHPPKWMDENSCQYVTIMGSMAYGVNKDDSDLDIYGFAIPPRGIVFPHLDGHIQGFGKQPEVFGQWQEHHVKDPDGKQKEYDFSIYNIVKYFHLVMENNPNMIDSLFTPDNCVIHQTKIGQMVRENRRDFLHKGAWHKFKGYAYSNFHRYKQSDPTKASNEKRAKTIEDHGYDTKSMYHVIRLVGEIEQILTEGDLDLLRNREQLKSVRRGEWSLEKIEEFFQTKEKSLEQTYLDSKLPYGPDEPKIRNLLLNCLEEYYGDLSQAVKRDTSVEDVLKDLNVVIKKYGG